MLMFCTSRTRGLILLSLLSLVGGVCLPEPLWGQTDVCLLLRGAVIVSQDGNHEFLGKIASKFDAKSIFNDYGTYGNEFSSKSIWNEFSRYGNEFNAYSPFNEFSSKPPMIIKEGQVIGYLSNSRAIRGAVPPNLLRALCEDAL